MKRLCLVLLAVFSVSGFAQENRVKLNPLFSKKAPQLLTAEGNIARGSKVICALAANGECGLKEEFNPANPAPQVFFGPYFYGIDQYGRWILDVSGEMNYVPPKPITISLDGEVAFVTIPQSMERTTAKPWIKSFQPTYFDSLIYFEKTGTYQILVDVPGASHQLMGQVLVRPHGEKYSECLAQGDVVRIIFVVDWLELSPIRVLHATMSYGTYVGDIFGFQAYQIPETGIWVAFYEFDIPLSEYQSKLLYSPVPFPALTLASDAGQKVIMYEVNWDNLPLAPCPADSTSSTSSSGSWPRE